jgi:chromosome segregation protein
MVQFTKLRLSGFKSFVEPTEFEIGHGLTGIVGPNGCGKSNLVEALRWAMGENSPKRMRTSDMDDVIFNGTELRPARNNAEVVISLDNADRTAPAEINDADELEVSRKIERDVGSTYKINGKNVRMRDVQLLFADSSIGAHSPALVSQGRVADMINAKPTQRRMVLEEAAGISGLHARRHEAELKLRAAETNLTRVDDVLGSMNTQLESLKKQARQASRYRNLSGHIQSAEGGLLFLKWQDSQTAVAAALHAFTVAESAVQERMLDVTRLTTAQTEAAAGVPQLRHAETEAAAALQRLKLAFGGLESEERQVNDERTRAENLITQYTGDRAHEQTQREEAIETLQRLDQERDVLVQQGQNFSETISRLQGEKSAAETVVLETENALASLTEQVAREDAERNAAERQIQELQRRMAQLASRKAALENEHAALIAATPARAELDQISSDIAQNESALQQAQAQQDQSENDRLQATAASEAATVEEQRLARAYTQIAAEAQALERILNAGQQSDFAPVLELLNVEAGFEKALAVALGNDLQASLDASAPMFWRDLPAYEQTTTLPGGAEPLGRFVLAPDALKRTLSHIGVVADAATAEQLMPQLQPGQCLVSKDGGAWRWDGFVVTPNAENESAIRLQQKNRLAELTAQKAGAESELNTARAAAEQAKELRQQAENASREARQNVRNAEESLSTLRRRHAQLSDQLSAITAKITGLASAVETVAQELTAAEQTLSEAQQFFADLPDTAAAKNDIFAIKTRLLTERQTLVDCNAALSESQRSEDQRQRRITQISDEADVWAQRLTRIDQRLADIAERILQSQEVLARLAERPAQIEQEKQSLLGLIADAEAKRRDAADILQTAENTAAELQRDLRAAESGLSDARENRAMAQATVNTAQHTQSTIETAINEKFQVAPEALASKLELDTENLGQIDELQSRLERLLRERDNMGPVNLRAEVESDEITQKMGEMTAERDDLVQAIEKLREGINKLNKEARERLLSAFDTVNGHFQKLFSRLFNGGAAHLKLIEAEDPLESGLEIYAQPPGKKLTVLSLLSGGEQTLTSIALIFAMFLTNPAPICVLDEVDAPLDESNVDRYCTLLEDLVKECKTRFIIITHHRMTMARMDRLYGVTMSERGVSQLVSVDLKQFELQLDQAA